VIDTANWSPSVWQWERFKATNNIGPGDAERIPESFLRDTLATRHCVSPADVTSEQIDALATDLCAYYGRFLMTLHAPQLSAEAPNQWAEPHVEAGPAFWKARENEFREHDTEENRSLLAVWFSVGNEWKVRGGGGRKSPPGSRQVFKSLAREAAKGLVGPVTDDSWRDWLDALLLARDTHTNERIYSRIKAVSSMTLSETEFAQKRDAGEYLPPESMVEFQLIEKPAGDAERTARIRRRWFWDTYVAEVAGLFKASADHCLYLRSRFERLRRQRQTATDLNEEYARRRSGLSDAIQKRQRDFLRDARQYTAKLLKQAVNETQMSSHPSDTDIISACDEIRDRLVVQVWNELVRVTKDFTEIKMGFAEFEVALWNHGFPTSGSLSLRDRLEEAFRERVAKEDDASPGSAVTEARGPASKGTPAQAMPRTLSELVELPSRLQDQFEAAKATAELAHARLFESFPQNPDLVGHTLNHIVLTQSVFFAYCKGARSACRKHFWSLVKTREASEAALAIICDYYFVRKNPDSSEAQRSAFRNAFAEGVRLDARWTEHLTDLAGLPGTAPETVTEDRVESRHPGALPTKTRARVQAINAKCLATLRSGTLRHQAICTVLQECYDVLIDGYREHHDNLPEVVLTTDIPATLLKLAVDVGWLEPSILDESESDQHNPRRNYLVEPVYRNWLSELLESRMEYWRARTNAEPFGIELPKPDFVIMKLPAATAEGLLLQAHEELKARNAPRKFLEPALRNILMAAGVAPSEITTERMIRLMEEHVGDPTIPLELVPQSVPPGDSAAPAPTRADWLSDRLRERKWNKHDVRRHNGPDHKTVQKILDGFPVREEILGKLAQALSMVSAANKLPPVKPLDIPRN
jgi:hypothetical protein